MPETEDDASAGGDGVKPAGSGKKTIRVEIEWCKGCRICIEKCPVDALEEATEMNKKGYFPPVMKEDNECNYCRLCELLCPDFAIGIVDVEEEGEEAAEDEA